MEYIPYIRQYIGNKAIFMPCSGGIFINDNKILLQKRADDGTWAIHGGALELGETFEDCLKREIKVELNIEITKYKFLKSYSGKSLHHVYPNGDEVYGIVDTFLVEEYDGDFKIDESEVSELKWFDIDMLPNNIHKPDIELINDAIEYIKNKK